ncbi:MAG: hypothetical protein COY40_04070 [Alphaproteobacteria bacterium CG_4_10_14_0_8_um_filter_53_9]|nr:MAG: hypothetical protein COY40_04070 [Alphaproteobacteria bacterium CG_4_10_14_0_8_um_filter_53_9]
MNGPKARFAMVVGFLVIAFWLYLVVSTYLFGERGLNFIRYGQGVATLAAAAFGGFLLVWLGLKGIEWSVNRQKTGFEGAYTDEYGTVFKMTDAAGKPVPFALSLSKFLPLLVAPPTHWPGLHPLEAELIGFLNGFRHWPYDLKRQDLSLHAHSMALWDAVRQMEGTTWLHRVAALAQDLGKTYAYQEKRETYPLSSWWKKDKVRFERRTLEHGGMAATILATMPSFRHLSDNPEDNTRLRRVLLTALKHSQNPLSLPTNADPQSREIIDVLHRALTHIRKTRGEQAPLRADDDLKRELTKHIASYLPALLDEMKLGSNPSQPDTEGVRLDETTAAVRQRALLGQIAQLLTPSLREHLNLWESGGGADHPAWPILASILSELSVLLPEWGGVPSYNGTVQMVFGDTTWPHACVLRFNPQTFPTVVQRLQDYPILKEGVFALADKRQLAAAVQDKAVLFDQESHALLGA